MSSSPIQPYPFKPVIKKNTFQKKIILFFVIILLIVTSIIFFYNKVSSESRANRRLVSLTEKVLAETDSVMSFQKDIIIQTRGYIITGDRSFLNDYNKNNILAEKHLNDLKLILVNEPKQAARLKKLDSLITEYKNIRAQQILLRQNSDFNLQDEALQVAAASDALTQLRAIFTSITTDQKNILEERRTIYRASAEKTSKTILILITLFIILILLAFVIVFINTRKRNKAEEELIKSKELIDNIIHHAPVLVNVKDTSGRYILVNNQFANALYSTPEEMIGKKVSDFIDSDTARKIDEQDEEMITSKEPMEMEVKLPADDGLHTYITSKFPLFDSKGKLYAIGSTSVDITPLKEAHKAIELSYQQQEKILNGFQQALSASSDVLFIINQQGEVLNVSSTVEALLGYKPKEMMSKKFVEFMYKEDIEMSFDAFSDILEGKILSDFTNRYIKKDGTIIPITWSGRWDENDKMLYAIARDATKKIKSAQQLEESQSRLAYAQKIAMLGNWEKDLVNDKWTCSEEFYDLVGIEGKDGNDIQNILTDCIHPEDRQILNFVKKEAFERGKKINVEHRIIRKDGNVRYMHTKGEISYDKNNKPLWLRGTMQDITQRKKEEFELQKLNDDLKKKAELLKSSNEELERFAYVASHDLQEPLRMVSSFLTLLQKKLNGNLDDASKQYIHFAVDGAERMKGLIQDLLNYSRLGTTADNFSLLDLDIVVKNVLQIHEPTIRETGASIIVNKLPAVKGNKTQLSQLFQNLVGNALKYRSDKTPQIEIGCHEKENELEFFIKDNGIGIDKKFYDKIFVIFQRLHNKTEYSGTGIGLAICKKIVSRHGGNIWVDSVANEGSTFYFNLKKPANV